MTGPALLSSSSNVSQTTVGEMASTPPTSSEGPSSQCDQPPQPQPGVHAPSAASQGQVFQGYKPGKQSSRASSGENRDDDTERVSPASPAQPASLSVAGQKRMASGAVKPTSASVPASPSQTEAAGDSESPRPEALRGNIAELGSQLRARLSYALVKVQHGWQTKTLDEVEIITSQQASPASLKRASNRTPLRSPHSMVASLSQGSSSFSDEQNPQSPIRAGAPRPLGNAHDFAAGNGIRGIGFTHPAEQPSHGRSQTYESFWRDHSTNSVSKLLEAQRTGSNNSQTGPSSLAPPANIVSYPSHPRRVSTSSASRHSRPPMLSHMTAADRTSNLSIASSTTSSTVPATPPPPMSAGTGAGAAAHDDRRTPLLRTPSQKAAMEQDAVETLIYMSSPGHARPPSATRLQHAGPGGILQSPTKQPATPRSGTARPFGAPANKGLASKVPTAMGRRPARSKHVRRGEQLSYSSSSSSSDDDDDDCNNETNTDNDDENQRRGINAYSAGSDARSATGPRFLFRNQPFLKIPSRMVDDDIDRMLDALSSSSSSSSSSSDDDGGDLQGSTMRA